MVVEFKYVMQSERHHIVHTSLPALHHHTLHSLHKSSFHRKRLTEPLSGNLLATDEWAPRQTAKSIPVGL